MYEVKHLLVVNSGVVFGSDGSDNGVCGSVSISSGASQQQSSGVVSVSGGQVKWALRGNVTVQSGSSAGNLTVSAVGSQSTTGVMGYNWW